MIFRKTEKFRCDGEIFKFVSKSRMNFASSNKDNVQFIKKTKRHEKASDSRRRSVRPRHLYRQCRHDRPISVSELPEKAQQFIRQHFPNEKVSFAKMERELFDTTYEVIFTSSSKVEFLKNGDWKEVDCKYSTVPAAIIPQQIAQYVPSTIPIRPSSRSTATNGITR